MHNLITAISVTLFLASATFAADDPIKARQEIMKSNGDAAKVIGGMLKQKRPFDVAAAMQAFKTWKKTAAGVVDLFPVGSETGGDTEAKMTIWTDRDGFNQKLTDLDTQVDGAIATAPDNLESLKQAAGAVFKTCKGCHKEYRVEKDKKQEK